jgi:hypothetical protein
MPLEPEGVNALTLDHRLEVLRTVYSTKSAELRSETDSANRIVTGFVTISFAVLAWLFARQYSTSFRLMIFAASAVGAFWVVQLIHRNYGRRTEIIQTLTNVEAALQLDVADAYLAGRAITAERYAHSWRGLHYGVIVTLTVAQLIPFIVTYLGWSLV